MTERIKKLEAFLQQSPDDCFLNHALALEYIKEGRDAEAQAFFEKNRANDPGYVATYYHLGKLLEQTGNTDGALVVYEEGMQHARAAADMHAYRELQAAYEQLAY